MGLYLICGFGVMTYYFSIFVTGLLFRYGDLVGVEENSYRTLGYWACLVVVVVGVMVY
jgi:hypothetical protein